MKKTGLLLGAILMTIASFGQEKRQCDADKLAGTPGIAVQKEYVNISKIKNLSIVVQYITDLTHHQKLSALDMEYSSNGDQPFTSSTILDPDEADGLISFLQGIQDNIAKSTVPKNYTEYTFMTKSGLEAGCYSDKSWKAYIKVDSEDGKTDHRSLAEMM